MNAEGVAARQAAYRAVRRVHERASWASPAVADAVAELPDGRDRAFAANLAFQTLRWEGTLDWALAQVLRRQDLDPRVRDVLRLGAWQIGYGGTPARAAVDTSVSLVRGAVGERACGFVNGVLRSLARRWPELPWPDAGTDEGLGLALGYPGWIVAEARARFGAAAHDVLAAGNEPPGLTLRAAAPVELVEELRGLGLEARPGRHAARAVRAPGADYGELRAVSEGRATAQDEASQLVTDALLACVDTPAPRILDACAGPGGKATDLAARGARVVAADLHPSRARLVVTAAARLGVTVPTTVADGRRPPWRAGAFDAVLLDVPCSGLGVVRRRPELRWRRQPDDVRDLARLQGELLDAAFPLVRPGGMLLYSACTWTVAETAAIVGAAARRHGLEPVEPPASLPGWRSPGDPGLLLRPDLHDTDGMYIACLRRPAAEAGMAGRPQAPERAA